MFPNVKIKAAYFPLHQIVELSDIDQQTFDSALLGNSLRAQLVVLPLLMHEVRHWWDHIGTLWGQKRLVAGFDAVHARLGGNEKEFWRIQRYHRLVNADHFCEYYSENYDLNPPDVGDKRWKWRLSCGVRFDCDGKVAEDKPIVFTQFHWGDGRPSCRVPFSVASLLETSSMSFELGLEANLMGGLAGEEKIFETALYKQKCLDFLYNPELAKYSVAVHCVANFLHLSDVSLAFKYANALSWLCLNLPSSLFRSLKIPDHYQSTWGGRCQAFIDNQDRGFAFLILIENMVDETDDIAGWLEATALKAGLPSMPEIEQAVQIEFAELEQQVLSGPHNDRLQWLLEEGRTVFEHFWPVPDILEAFRGMEKMPMPPILLSDMKLVQIGKKSNWTAPEVVENWSAMITKLESRFDQFVQICGV